jgi:hypothetical protein
MHTSAAHSLTIILTLQMKLDSADMSSVVLSGAGRGEGRYKVRKQPWEREIETKQRDRNSGGNGDGDAANTWEVYAMPSESAHTTVLSPLELSQEERRRADASTAAATGLGSGSGSGSVLVSAAEGIKIGGGNGGVDFGAGLGYEGEMVSPLDITMRSRETELALGLVFQDVAAVLPLCLTVQWGRAVQCYEQQGAVVQLLTELVLGLVFHDVAAVLSLCLTVQWGRAVGSALNSKRVQ